MSSYPSSPALLPAQPSLEQLRKLAKDLKRAVAAREPDAIGRVQQVLPESGGEITITQAQFVLAREYGFPSWPKLKAYVERITGAPMAQRIFVTEPQYFEGRAQGLLTTVRDGIATSLEQVRRFHPKFAGASDAEIKGASLSEDDGRLILAREHGFESWKALTAHLKALEKGATVEPFALAFQALKAGDMEAFTRVLRQDPSLVNAWGTNGNTLLNLAGSTRRLEATKLLLELGADPNLGNRYGWTPLHAAAYSNQREFAEVLLAAGASPQISARGEGGTPLVQALFWGHAEMADFLAGYGIFPNNLRAAAGLGRVDLLETFFLADGTLRPEAGVAREFYRPHGGFLECALTNNPQEILDEALSYAARCSRIPAMEFLLAHGAEVNGEAYNGRALHWAVHKGHLEAMTFLLDRGAEVNGISNFGGERGLTPLHISCWGGQLEAAKLLISRGADPELRDPTYNGTPLGWAQYNGQPNVADYLKTVTPSVLK
jgi:ankyrin repeat protein